MRIEHIMIAIILFALVVGVGYNLFANQINNYGLTGNSSIFNNIREKADVEDERDSLADIQGTSISDEDTESSLYKSGIPSSLSIFDTASVASDTIENIAVDTGLVHPTIKSALIAILIISCAAFMLYLVWRFKPQND